VKVRLPPERSSRSQLWHPNNDPNLKALLETTKRETRLLGDVQRHLLRPGANDERRQDELHPSEVSHNEWCPRASYYRLAGIQPHTALPVTHWRMQMIFDEGKDIHRKWQDRIWDIGRLSGMFYCQACHHSWWAEAPDECEQCLAQRKFLRYDEVPLTNEALHMVGHADGQDGQDLVEIKSIGLGTLRFEAPDLLVKHTTKLNLNGKSRTFLDYDALWNSIRVPFPSHIRQGHLYCFMSGLTDMIYLYECKWNQQVKEMVVKYRPERIFDRLSQCAEVVDALNGGTIPKCPYDGCADCSRYEPVHGRRRLIRRPAPEPTQASRRLGAGAPDRGPAAPVGVPGSPAGGARRS
jgi:hypothetical protein